MRPVLKLQRVCVPCPVYRGRGFTLIELVIVVVILGVLATLAAPSMKSLIATQRVKSAISDLQASLFVARSEAIKRANLVAVVPGDGASASGNWIDGWVSCVDANANDKCDSSELVIERRSPLSVGIADMNGSAIVYRRDGRLDKGAATIKAVAEDVSGVTARCVVIDLIGRPNVSMGDSCD